MVAIAAGGGHSLALKADGTVWAWGWDSRGQLGQGTQVPLTYSTVPIQVPALPGVRAIGAGPYQSFAITNSGIFAWGGNDVGQLGDGTTVNRLAPTLVLAGSNFIEVDGGGDASAALGADGTIWAWGSNNHVQVGDGTTIQRLTPVQTLISNVKHLSLGSIHSLALKHDGTVWVWGSDDRGQMGLGNPGSSEATPRQLESVNDVIAVSAGGAHSLALGQLVSSPIDEIAPEITCTVPGQSGWYADNINVACTAADESGGSGLANQPMPISSCPHRWTRAPRPPTLPPTVARSAT